MSQNTINLAARFLLELTALHALGSGTGISKGTFPVFKRVNDSAAFENKVGFITIM